MLKVILVLAMAVMVMEMVAVESRPAADLPMENIGVNSGGMAPRDAAIRKKDAIGAGARGTRMSTQEEDEDSNNEGMAKRAADAMQGGVDLRKDGDEQTGRIRDEQTGSIGIGDEQTGRIHLGDEQTGRSRLGDEQTGRKRLGDEQTGRKLGLGDEQTGRKLDDRRGNSGGNSMCKAGFGGDDAPRCVSMGQKEE